MKRFSIWSLIFFILTSCSVQKINRGSFETMKWIEGTWIEDTEGIIMQETWKYNAASGFNGNSMIFLQGEEIYKEVFQAILSDNQIQLRYTNSEESETLYLTQLRKTSFTFSNKDKNRQLQYSIRDSQTLILQLQETVDGKISRSKHTLKKK
jgi:hypothetical protein